MSRTIPSNTDNMVDSRDIIARVEELRADRDRLADELAEAEMEWSKRDDADADAEQPDPSVYMLDEDDAAELAALEALCDEAEGYVEDWRHGATLISDDYFTEYAKQLAEDIGAMPDASAWPGAYIDWDRAAAALQQDYTSVEWDGVTYWVR